MTVYWWSEYDIKLLLVCLNLHAQNAGAAAGTSGKDQAAGVVNALQRSEKIRRTRSLSGRGE